MTSLSWQSLRTRLVAGALCAAVASIWIVTLVIGKYLRADMEAAISAQQYSTVSLIASEIDRSVNERNAILGQLARRLGDAGEVDGHAAKALLESQSGLEPMFNWGVIVLDADGVAVSSVPGKHNRVGGRYGDLAFFARLKERNEPLITPPLRGRRTGAPVLTVAQAIRAPGGRFIGAVLGVTNLHEPNFLDQVGSAKYGRTGISWSPMPGRAPMSPRPTSAG